VKSNLSSPLTAKKRHYLYACQPQTRLHECDILSPKTV